MDACISYCAIMHNLRFQVDLARLDLQVELARLLYPLFIHVYLRLVSKEASEAAAQLFSKHKRRFAEATGINSRTRLQVRISVCCMCMTRSVLPVVCHQAMHTAQAILYTAMQPLCMAAGAQ